MTRAQQLSITKPEVDEEGFLLQPEIWNKDVAQLIAQGEVSGDLTEEHWKVIDYLRQYYLEYGTVPPVPMLRRDTGFNLRYIYKLFPSGLTRGACKIAGIPRITILPMFLYP